MKSFDVITVGNCMIDAFMAIQKNNQFTRIDTEKKELAFRYGEKIHVDSCDFMLGGNACNVGVGLSRLGFNTGLIAEIGDDELSKKIDNLLAKEPIDTSFTVHTPGKASSFAMGINFGNERTLFVDHVKRNHNFQFDDISTNWMYITSLGMDWFNAYSQAFSYSKKNNTRLAFSPGTHQMEVFNPSSNNQEGKTLIEEILKNTEILFVNKEEGERIAESIKGTTGITGIKGRDDVSELLVALQKLGPKIVSLTDGGNGAYSIDRDGIVRHIEKFPNVAVEKTGAGDAYAAGFLGAIILETSIPDSMQWGSINAASVITKTGAQAGLLSKQDIQEQGEKNSSFQSTII